MKLLLVLTGGTISTIIGKDNVMGIYGNSSHLILEKYQEKIGDREELPEFDIIEPIQMLSECSRPQYLEQIYYGILEKLGLGKNYMEVRENNKKGILDLVLKKDNFYQYDGIIVTHGSDTLSYTAAFLSIMFSWIKIPLVLTAADTPLSDSSSNGLKNFSDAIEFIKQKTWSGVFTIWQNRKINNISEENGNLFLASELLEADTYKDWFSSYTGQAFGKIQNGVCTIFEKRKENKKKEDNQYGYRKILDFHMQHEIFFLRPYPGLRYDLIKLNNTNISAVVHYLYHSATACSKENKTKEEYSNNIAISDNSTRDTNIGVNKDINYDNYNILNFAKYCKELGIDIYFAGFKSEQQRLYETNDLLLKSGLGKALYHVSPEMAYMKVLVAYNQTIMPVYDFLEGKE